MTTSDLDWRLGGSDGLVAGPTNSIADVRGVRVGHASREGDGWLTGNTVLLAPDGARAGVDVRGGGPATRETPALDPTALVETIHAVSLSGGSAYGLDSAAGVMLGLEDRGLGVPVGPGPRDVVPVVPAASIFDLGRGGDVHARPDPGLAREALEAAFAAEPGAAVQQGSVGAGTGAVTGLMRGGVGSASVVLPGGVTVAALVVLNSLGSPLDPRTAVPHGASALLRRPDGSPEIELPSPTPDQVREVRQRISDEIERRSTLKPLNTTLAVVATDADLTRAELTRLAAASHTGMARAIRPVATLSDGDVVFSLSPGGAGLPEAATDARPDAVNHVLSAGADALTRAIVHATCAATSTVTPAGPLVAYRDLFPRRPTPPPPR